MKLTRSILTACLAAALATCVAGSAQAQSWQDKLRAGVSRVQEDVKKGERPCQICRKTIRIGSICASCAARQASEKAGQAGGEASRRVGQAADNASVSIGDTLGKGAKAYQDAQKPEWQRFLESGPGMATIGGVFVLLLVVIILASRGRSSRAA